ncbi:hypothetical protein [Nostoc sp. NZL]|uniref:hypothetical protein n=1 Tax=Nostoc sp. NZL TaxID=2650612 RepID=UPI0018C6DE09|nr:hypothetical protein [Nostoc sp. NZL]
MLNRSGEEAVNLERKATIAVILKKKLPKIKPLKGILIESLNFATIQIQQK